MFTKFGNAPKYIIQAARMLVGIPDYDTYVKHMKAHHAEKPIMSYRAFFQERQQARYGHNGKGGMRCC